MDLYSSVKLGKNEDYSADGNFIQLPKTETTYVYSHNHHAVCASTHFSQLRFANLIMRRTESTIDECTEADHIYLQPFFFNNQHLY